MTTAPDKRPAFEPPAQLLKPTGYDPDMKRPASTVAGVMLVLLRVIAGVVWIGSIALEWERYVREIDATYEDVVSTPQIAETTLLVAVIAIGVSLVIDAVLAFFVLGGHNWARVIIMAIAAISITASFLQWWDDGLEITIGTTLLTLGLDILILLALSSRSAAAYARRKERR
ncbi:MAG TPA: hypothetical protein VNP97_14865 [Microbacterium sp.]|nr:hypothetical protein [Microbacterium sp.]